MPRHDLRASCVPCRSVCCAWRRWASWAWPARSCVAVHPSDACESLQRAQERLLCLAALVKLALASEIMLGEVTIRADEVAANSFRR